MTCRSGTFAVRGVSSARELAAANDLLARTQLPPYGACRRWLEETGPHWPGFEREHTRVAYDGDALIGGLRILTLALRIGVARLKCGGIGWVSTAPAHRNRGVCRALMADAHDYMARHGYHVSLLFGVPDLYQRFGYVTAAPTHSILVDANTLPSSPKRPRTRRVTPADKARLYDIFSSNMKDAPFAIERGRAYFDTLFGCTAQTIPFPPEWRAAAAVLDRRGKIVGYFMPQRGENEWHVKELGVAAGALCGAVFDAALAHARRAGLGRVRFHVPPWHVFARYLRDHESLHETHYYRNREGMLALIDRDRAVVRMAPEWRRQLRAAGIGPGQDASALHMRVPLTNQDCCRLLAGFTSGEEWLRDNDLRLPEAKRRAFEAMFPRRDPFIWPIDHF